MILYVYTVFDPNNLERGGAPMRGRTVADENSVRPGRMAIISRCNNTAHIGLVVRVLARHESPEFDWDVELLGKPVMGYATDARTVGVFKYAAVFEWNLSPLEEETGHSCQELRSVIAHAIG